MNRKKYICNAFTDLKYLKKRLKFNKSLNKGSCDICKHKEPHSYKYSCSINCGKFLSKNVYCIPYNKKIEKQLQLLKNIEEI